MSVTNMVWDPYDEGGLLSKFGSLEIGRLLRDGRQVVTQLRSIFVSANAVLVPVIANNMKSTRRT